MGMMMMCETRQMSSNPEGHGAAGDDGQALSQLAVDHSLVDRQRGVAAAERRWQSRARRSPRPWCARCHELDPTRVVSAAVNGDNEKGVSDALDIIGFNYNLKVPTAITRSIPSSPSMDRRRRARSRRAACIRPTRCATWSTPTTCIVPMGRDAEEWWKFYGTREWEAGGFAWTGFDYRGEPTPYGWPSINSQFGIVDMCGFPKDNFYLLQGVVGQGAVAASVSALELRGQGRRRDSGVGLLEPR